MRSGFKLFFIMVAFVCVPNLMRAQSNDSKIIKTEEGKFIIHTVEKGQTLYAISKLYSVSVEDIVKSNPNVNEFGIRIDQNLRIPVKLVDKKEAKKSEIELSGDTIYHEVLKKETLYALSKKYEISVEDIEKYNPDLAAGLKIGMVIKIPITQAAAKEGKLDENVKPKADSLKLHEVKPKETLYSLSKKYGVSTDSIQMVNDGLPLGLQIGSTIRIPVKNPLYELGSSQINSGLSGNHGEGDSSTSNLIRVGIFLPFSVDSNAVLQKESKEEHYFSLTKISLEFYRGFSLSVDSLKSLGYNMDVHYFDTENDTAKCSAIMSDSSISDFDLFIGPLFQINFDCISKKAKELGIPIVSPVKISSSVLLNNRYVVKSYASSPSQVINMAKYVAQNFADSNLIIISGGSKNDTRYANIFQKHLINELQDSVEINKIWQASTYNYSKYIKTGEHNYIALISEDEGFVSQSVSVFYRMLKKDTKISVFGLDNWTKFKSIGLVDLQNLNVTIPAQKFIDYQSPSVIEFIHKYRKEYFTEPSEHVFTSFDIGMFFISSVYHANMGWEENVDNTVRSGLITRFDFVKIGEQSGFENRGGFILEYDDYSLILKK